MANKKVRVYELAKEIGIDNKATLELCISLGIDVKSHSSSIEEAQADRARNKAKTLGLYTTSDKESKDKEPKSVKQTDSKLNSTTAKSTKRSEKSVGADTDEDQKLKGTPGSTNLKSNDSRVVSSRTESSTTKSKPDKAASNEPEAGEIKGEAAGSVRISRKTPAGPLEDKGQLLEEENKVKGHSSGGITGVIPPKSPRPLSSSGKPIPPPPRPLLSPTGKPIPPPPRAGQRPQSDTERPGSASAPRRFNSSTVAGRQKFTPRTTTRGETTQSDPSRTGFARPGVSPSDQALPPPKGAANARRPQKKTSVRRRRNVEELEPTRATAYNPSNAPVPEGEIIIERSSTAQEIAPKLNRSAGDIVRFLLLHGEMVAATQSLSDDMIELFAAEIGAEVKLVDVGQEQEATLLAKYFSDLSEENEGPLVERPPVITVMGHVDHGKTKLLDKIRNANVVAGEAGGITQHIGAYQVEENSKLLTFIDTPGHEAFSAMRARGAKVTDIVVLVVAADDGVMPQTVEAIEHAKAANVPIVVAINKIDRPDADPQRVMQQISEHGLLPEEWGGETIVVPISAVTGEGLTELLDNLLLVSEMNELTANREARCRSVVLESNLDVGRGPVATVVVQSGVLKVGDPIVVGSAWGKVKVLINDKGQSVKEVYPSAPVQVVGLSEPPQAGDEMLVTSNIADARIIGELREKRSRMAANASVNTNTPGAKLEDIFDQISKGEAATLNLVLKADVQGSLEAITQSLKKLERDEVKISIVQRGVGGITESDVNRAIVTNATIVGFNVRPDRRSRELAELNNIEIRTYEIIYKVIEDMENALLGLLKPEFEEIVTGEAEVLQVFRVPKIGAIAGCIVRNGAITRGSQVRFLREGVIIWRGTITSLKRFKDDAREVTAGFECGIGLSDFQDLKPGDIIETFEEKEIARSL